MSGAARFLSKSRLEARSEKDGGGVIARRLSEGETGSQAPPSRFAYSSSIASSYRRSASISASVFSRLVPAPVFTPAPVALEVESPVCDCSEMGWSTFGSEPDVEVEVRKGIVTANAVECDGELNSVLNKFVDFCGFYTTTWG